MKDRYPLNKGDFYINDGECTACGAPQAEAPDLIEHGKRDGHCYFKKQPQSEQELDRAIKSMMVSCTDALRYGGTDEKILKRLYENGMADLCDHKPEGECFILARDRVSFSFKGLIDELATLLIAGFASISSHIIVEAYTNSQSDHFGFIKRWTGVATGVSYDCKRQTDGRYTLKISDERGRMLENASGEGSILDDLLKANPLFIDIRWFARDMPDTSYYDKPY